MNTVMCFIQLKCCWDLDYLIDIPYCLLEVTDSIDSWFHLDLLEPKTFVMGVGMAVKCLIARKYSVLLRSITSETTPYLMLVKSAMLLWSNMVTDFVETWSALIENKIAPLSSLQNWLIYLWVVHLHKLCASAQQLA